MSVAQGPEWIDDVQRQWGMRLSLKRVGQGLIVGHRNARHFVAGISLKTPRVSVPLSAEFSHHRDYGEEQLLDEAMARLRPRLAIYRERGYGLREVEWCPVPPGGGGYSCWQVPMVVVYMERTFEGWEEVVDELPWLVSRLTHR